MRKARPTGFEFEVQLLYEQPTHGQRAVMGGCSVEDGANAIFDRPSVREGVGDGHGEHEGTTACAAAARRVRLCERYDLGKVSLTVTDSVTGSCVSPFAMR